jgi:hypothetical protein
MEMKYLIKFTADDFPYYYKSLDEFPILESKARLFNNIVTAYRHLKKFRKIKKLLEASPRVLEVK